MEVWAYNTESEELVKIAPHPTPNPELDSEELARDHLVKNYVHVIYFSADDLSPELFPTEV